MRPGLRVVRWILVMVLLAAVAAWFFALSPLAPRSEVVAGCAAGVCVTEDDGLEVAPESGAGPAGLIVYTGARVPPAAYLPVAERIAAAGHRVFIPALLLNFAIFDSNAAAGVIDAHPEVERWVVAGHSLGGVMAARFAAANPEVDGLVLWGSYPEDSVDLAGTDLEVVSIYGSNDRLSTPAEVLAAGARLPAGTTFVPIEGGNHAQFGDYGEQRGDGPAGIAADDQWAQVAGATVAALDRVAGG